MRQFEREDTPLGSDTESILEGVLAGAKQAEETLRGLFEDGLRWYLGRLGAKQVAEKTTRVHLLVIEAIRTGRIQRFQEIAPFARSTAQFLTEEDGDRGAPRSGNVNPDKAGVRRMESALAALSPDEREALRRYYSGGAEPICTDAISEPAFCALKSRLKSQYRVDSPAAKSPSAIFWRRTRTA